MGQQTSHVAVIIVNYGTADLSLRAVESVLARDHGGRRVEVHLVDNASPGGDAAFFARVHEERGWGERVTLWPEAENHGFGRGNNVVLEALAARDVPPRYVFLLNPDAELENEAIAALADTLDAEARAGAAGAAMVGADAQPIAAAFRFPTGTRESLRLLNFGPAYRLLPGSRIALPPDQPAGPVDWVTGAAVMFRFSTLGEVGFFDPAFFLYYEEVELMHRITRAGWTVVHVPDARVRHEEGAATAVVGAGRHRPYYVYDSLRHYLQVTAGRASALVTAGVMLPLAGLNMVHRGLRGKAPTIPSGFFANHWRHVLKPLILGSRQE